MSTIPSLQSAAALFLQPAVAGARGPDTLLAGSSVLASANGMKLVIDPATKQAQVKVAEALFDSSRPNTLTLKVHLMERVAGALGVDKNNYTSDADYRAAIKHAFVELAAHPDARQMMESIEKELGLDKIGVSLKTLVDAIAGEDPTANEELDAALAKYADKAEDGPSGIQMSDIGVYRF